MTRLGAVSPVLRVGLLFPSAAELTELIFAAYGVRRPDVSVDRIDVSIGGEDALVDEAVDVAILWSPVASPLLCSIELFRDQMAVVMAKRHRLAGRSCVAASDVVCEHYTVTSSMSPEWRAASTLLPWRRRVGQQVPVEDVTQALHAIASGAAVSVGPMSLQRYGPVEGLTCVPLSDTFGPSAVVAYRCEERRRIVLEFASAASDIAARHLGLVPGACRPRARPASTATLTPQQVRPNLSARELQALALLSDGLTAAAVGSRMNISTLTVRKHLQNTYAKLGVSDRLIAVDVARRAGLL